MSGGATFGDHRLVKRLAAGGTSEVFLARTAAGTQVALKRVLPSLRDDVELAREFLDEARIASQLDHPYLVRVHDVGRHDRTVFLTMELVRGSTLAELAGMLNTRGTPWPWTLAARTVAQVAEALEYLHGAESSDGTALGLVHRDVNPSNIMLGVNGAPRLVDLGSMRGAHRWHQTQPGLVKLKRAYASPEQVEGTPVDARTDVHGLAVTLYALLAGASPFEKPTLEASLDAVVSEVPKSLRAHRSDVPRVLASLLEKSLEKSPANRPQSARAFRLGLEESLRKEDPVGLPEVAALVSSLHPGQGRLNVSVPAKPDAPTQRTQATRHQTQRTPPLTKSKR